MIVDTHSHIDLPLGDAGHASYEAYGRRLEGLDAYLYSYEQNGVDACWVFGHRGFRDSSLIQLENEALASVRSQCPGRLHPWGTVNPTWPERQLRAEIERIAALRLVGVKLVPIIQGFAISCPGINVVAEEAQRLSLAVFFHDGSPQYSSAIQVVYFARENPGLRVVSGHAGLRELWPDLIPAVRELPNLHVCLSGPTQWGIQALYDELGPAKLVFGSDGGLGHPAVTKAYLRRIARLEAPQEHKDLILGTNAMRFLFGDDWREAGSNVR